VPKGYWVMLELLRTQGSTALQHWMAGQVESYSHRMVWVGRELRAHPASTPAMDRAAPHQLRLPKAPSSLALSTSRDGAAQLLWAAVPAPHHSQK